MRDTYLYRWSAEDARRQNELALWRASHLENIACKKAIEEAVRQHYDGAYLDDNCLSDVLQEFGYKRTAWVLANTLQQQEWDGRFSRQNKAWAKQTYIPSDQQHNLDFVVTCHSTVLDGVVNQYRRAYQALGLFDSHQCEPDSFSNLDYEGKVLVLSPDTLNEAHLDPHNQLWLAHDGFGCSPHAIGRSIRCTCLGDGEQTRWNRSDFIGVLSPDYLPDWAKAKLSELGVGNIPMSRADLEKSLSQKIESGWQSFTQNILSLSPQEIMEQADEIAAARLCRDELTTNIGQYSRDLLEFLNAIPEPLEYLRDRWVSEQNVDHKEEMNHVIWSLQEEYQSEAQMEQEMPDGLSME